MSNIGRARAHAHANIALAKYWGKSDARLNLPAVPSVSLTLREMTTTTTVDPDPRLKEDVFELDGRPARQSELRRVVEMLERVRELARSPIHARVESRNDFPTASGLASSASGFAALAAATTCAYGVSLTPAALSALARASSASAARSVFGGFVLLPAGERGDGRLAARALHPENHWDVRIVVAVTDEGEKDIGSTTGMEGSRKTSPLYAAWLDQAEVLTRRLRKALTARDLDAVGTAMEQSTVAFHAVAMSSVPPAFYWKPATLAVLETVRGLRAKGVPAYATMDAGPHVKVLCEATNVKRVERALRDVPGLRRTIVGSPGPGAVARRL